VNALCVISISLLGCKPKIVDPIVPQFVAKPTAVSFEACPNKNEQMAIVNDVFPDLKKFKIENQGKALGTLKMSLAGTDAAAFKIAPGAPG
jgi:hypothetical protein